MVKSSLKSALYFQLNIIIMQSRLDQRNCKKTLKFIVTISLSNQILIKIDLSIVVFFEQLKTITMKRQTFALIKISYL